jgi:type IV secretory pathway VirB2 component (pilin)
MKKLFMFALFGFVAVAVTMVPEMALAATDAGGSLLTDINNMLGGSVGTIAGLGIAVLGLYMWLVQQASWGIVMIIGGVLITIFPQVFTGLKSGVTKAVATSAPTTP